MRRIVITGAGRGLGLAFVRQALARGDRVHATVRIPAKARELRSLADAHPERLFLHELDVADPDAVDRLFNAVSAVETGLDLLINNAGINSMSGDAGGREQHLTLGRLDGEAILGMIRINAVAPLMIAQRFLPLLESSDAAAIVNISSWFASISENSGGNYSYRASKTALNMLTSTLAHDLKDKGIVALAVNPGWMQTDMGGPNARLTPDESAGAILDLADTAGLDESGGFFDWDGARHAW